MDRTYFSRARIICAGKSMGIMEIEVELIEPGGMKRVSCVSCLAMMTHALEKLRTYKKVSLGTK